MDTKPTPGGLADTDEEWLALSKAPDSPFIRSLEDWDAAVKGAAAASPLAALPSQTLERFRDQLRFVEIRINGEPYRKFLLGFYFGDLVEEHGYSEDQLLEVAAMFGIGPQRFRSLRDYFGDFGPDERIICRRRPYFYCGRYIP